MKCEFMELALELARQGLGRTSPNPAVGAVLVRDGEIVGRGFHTWSGVDHAEIVALHEAGARARGSTAYVTLEPCSHMGRTGPCADALIAAGVARVVAAMEDPNPEVSGRGLARLRAAGVEVELAREYEAAAAQINEAFVHAMRFARPFVTLKAAMTLDGKIAARRGQSGWITSERARAHAQMLRHSSDAILTGIGTVLADDPLLTDRTGLERSRPLLRVVLDSRLRIPLGSRLVQSARGDVVVFGPGSGRELRELGVEVRTGGLAEALAYLQGERYRSVLIEAGAGLNGSALDAGIVDKVFFYYAPTIFGGAESLSMAERCSPDVPVRIERVRLHDLGDGEFALEGYVHRDR